MSDKNPTLQDVWRLLGRMHRRIEGYDERFDALERRMVALGADVTSRLGKFEADVAMRIGALKESIEARD
jgi:hypothetical protein